MFNLESIIALIISVVLALSIHEMAHALVSYWLGDPTAKRMGRISLNPLDHIDWIGVLCLLFFHIGWAKPVPIDASYYKDRKTGIIWTSFAGPMANFLLSFVCVFLVYLIVRVSPSFYMSSVGSFLATILWTTASISISLGVFNLIPIPPLDGSKIFFAFLPDDQYYRFVNGTPFMSVLLVLIIYSGVLNGPMAMIQSGILDAIANICSLFLGI